MIKNSIEFPSPSRGSYFSIVDKEMLYGSEKKTVSVPFPGIFFLNMYNMLLGERSNGVSVPFPGILFLNLNILTLIIIMRQEVSVPFPGILFLN